MGIAGSPSRGIIRTSLPFTIIAAPAQRAKPPRSRLAHYFKGTQPRLSMRQPSTTASRTEQHRNPIAVAREWQRALAEPEGSTRADVARKMAVSRARVTQVLGLVDLAPRVIAAVEALGDPMPGAFVSVRSLRPLLRLAPEEEERALEGIVRAGGLQQHSWSSSRSLPSIR